MSETERTTIRIVGLAVHGLGFLWLIAATAGSGLSVFPGVLAFAIGGAWGWGMVVMAARQAAETERARSAHQAYRERTGQAGFSSRFDDEPEAVIAPPPGARADRL